MSVLFCWLQMRYNLSLPFLLLGWKIGIIVWRLELSYVIGARPPAWTIVESVWILSSYLFFISPFSRRMIATRLMVLLACYVFCYWFPAQISQLMTGCRNTYLVLANVHLSNNPYGRTQHFTEALDIASLVDFSRLICHKPNLRISMVWPIL